MFRTLKSFLVLVHLFDSVRRNNVAFKELYVPAACSQLFIVDMDIILFTDKMIMFRDFFILSLFCHCSNCLII